MHTHSELVDRIAEEVRMYTMVPLENLQATIRLTLEAIDRGLPGHIVECGTWKGGSSYAMLLAQRYRYGSIVKPVWMFDSFQGLPPVDERDGPMAKHYEDNAYAPGNYDNCTASISEVRAAKIKFGFTDDEAIVVPGWFNQTIPSHLSALQDNGISVLRIDCDWYEPVHFVLSQLVPLAAEESPIIIDDYYAWDGCARAVHAYLHENNLCYRIRAMDKFYGAWMYKRAFRSGAL